MKRVWIILLVLISLGLPISASGDTLEQGSSIPDNNNSIGISREISDSIPHSIGRNSEDEKNLAKVGANSSEKRSIENSSSHSTTSKIEPSNLYQQSKEPCDRADNSSDQAESNSGDTNAISLKHCNPNNNGGATTKSATGDIVVEIKKKNYVDSHIFWNYQWDMQQVTNNGESYTLHQISKKTSVGIIDSGILAEHSDLLSSLGSHMKNFVPKGGFNNEEDEEKGEAGYIIDKMGHGTEVAGQITANGNILGVAPGVTINIYRVFGERLSKAEWISEAIKKAADDGNQIITVSAGQYLMISGSYEDGTNDFQSYLKYKEAVDYATEKGSLVVAALGNDSLNVQDNEAMLNYIKKYKNVKIPGKIIDVPSVFKNVVAVGGIDSHGNISDFSNVMLGAIYAPAGTTINLKRYGQENFISQGYFLKDWIFTTSYTGWYQYVYGNSFAAPKVAAALALIADKYDIRNPMGLKNFLLSHSPEIKGIKILKIVELLNSELAMIDFDSEAQQNSVGILNFYAEQNVKRNINIQEKKVFNFYADGNNQINLLRKRVNLAKENDNPNVLPSLGEKKGNSLLMVGIELSILYLLIRRRNNN